MGNRTLLDDARQRAERSISPEQIVFSLTRHHRAHYLRDLGDAQRLVQPCNKGTAPAILSALLHIAQRDTDAIVAVLPSDHYYSQERIFTETLESAFAVAQAQPGSIVLLGASPTRPEVEYGWIEVGGAVSGLHLDALQVKGFREKPPLPIAEYLLRSGSLWNTFVMVGYGQTFLEMASASIPGLLSVLRSPRIPPLCGGERRIPDWLYNRIAPADFSHRILSSGASRLLALRLGGIEWSDLGDPDRVMHTLLQTNAVLPAWAKLWGTLRGVEVAAAQHC